jgi:hypothetical protein
MLSEEEIRKKIETLETYRRIAHDQHDKAWAEGFIDGLKWRLGE